MTRDEIERTVYEAIEASQPVGPESAPAYFRRCDALAKKAADLILSDRAGEGGGEIEAAEAIQRYGREFMDFHDGGRSSKPNAAEYPEALG